MKNYPNLLWKRISRSTTPSSSTKLGGDILLSEFSFDYTAEFYAPDDYLEKYHEEHEE